MIEEQMDDLEDKVDKLNKVLFSIARETIKEPIQHTQECKEEAEKYYKSYDFYYRRCYCNSDIVNEYLGLPIQNIIEPERLKEIKKPKKKRRKK